ncbi:hypothetical protein [Acerihabitans sp.]|uniref:hypothetical protein n=1 Tax=Acerihabitans sp. TaxID=2811394 RepID=UPI002ED83272
MADKKQSRLFSFRAPANLADLIDEAVKDSGKDKSAWLLSAVMDKLGCPDGLPSAESRMEGLISQMETLLNGTTALPNICNQTLANARTTGAAPLTAKEAITLMVKDAERQGIQSSNKLMVAKLNELGIRPARGGPWTVSAVDSIKRRMQN